LLDFNVVGEIQSSGKGKIIEGAFSSSGNIGGSVGPAMGDVIGEFVTGPEEGD